MLLRGIPIADQGLSGSSLPIQAAGDMLAPANGQVPTAPDLSPYTQLLSDMTASLSQGQALDQMLTQFLRPIMEMTQATGGLVRVLADDGQHFRLVGQHGLPAALVAAEQWVDRQCGACGWAANQADLAWADNTHACVMHWRQRQEAQEAQGAAPLSPPHGAVGYVVAERSASSGLETGGASSAGRMLAVPMRYRDQLLGIYNLFFDPLTALDARVAPVLRSAGELLGLALHSARLEREHLRTTVMDERRWLASEVHDGVAQTLVYANMRLPLLQDAMERGDQAQARRYLGDVEQALAGVHSNLRDIMANYRAPMAAQGLLLGLQDISHNFRTRSGIALEFQCDASDLGLDVAQEVQVFHIVQEALSNVSRHAQATQAYLKVQRHADALEISVRDNGQGLPAAAAEKSGHYGLEIMQERARRIGGQVQWASPAQGGTEVQLTVSLAPRSSPSSGDHP